MAEGPAEQIFDHAVAGAVKCQAHGCPNWFIRQGNRHRYCKGPNCTYKRGGTDPAALIKIGGATGELLRRMAEEEGAGEVGPGLLVKRREDVTEALREHDAQSLAGALIDEASAAVWWADRAMRGELPKRPVGSDLRGPLAAAQKSKQAPIGLVHAALASHVRTAKLAEHRHDLLWEMLRARDEFESASRGVEQVAGEPAEADAQLVLDGKRDEYDASKRAYEAAEAAWRERMSAMSELLAAGESLRGAA